MAIHPASVKNSFGGHLILWALFLPLLSIVFMPLLQPDQNISKSEVKMVQGFNIDVDKITARTNDVFSSTFIKSGFMPKTEDFFGGMSLFGGSASHSGFAAKWIRGVWLQVYKAIWRINVLFYVFFIPLVALCIPSAIDGFAVRARKRYRFESYNPIFFYSSMHTLVLIIGLFIFLPLAPISLSANLLAILLGGLAIAVWIAASNFQTGS